MLVMSHRIRFVLLTAIGVLWLALPLMASPNVVLILADDLGFGDVRVLQPESGIETPNMDRLASQGMTFLDAHSPSAVCTPTRYGLLTGRYCWRTTLKRGVLGGYSKPLLSPQRQTLGSMLQQQGYQTGAIGKWHLGMDLPVKAANADTQRWDGDPGIDFAGTISDSPNHHGFDYYFGVSASLDMAPYVYIQNDRFTQIPVAQQAAVPFPHFVRKGPRAEDFVIDQVLDRITNEAVEFIEKTAGKKPFFLYVPFTAPHKPTQPHERFKGTTGLGEYGDFVAQTDWSVGQILNAIDSAGIQDDTLVIFTSDNGSYMFLQDPQEPADHVEDAKRQAYFAKHHRPNGPFRGTKADIYEAGHHVPFFVRWPQHVKPGSTCSEPICHTDCFATLAEIVGHQKGAGDAPDSYSLLGLLKQQPNAKRGAPVVHHSVAGMFAIREGKWKLILGNGSGGREKPRGEPFAGPFQLYNIETDVAESKNVAEEHPDVVARLTAALHTIRERE